MRYYNRIHETNIGKVFIKNKLTEYQSYGSLGSLNVVIKIKHGLLQCCTDGSSYMRTVVQSPENEKVHKQPTQKNINFKHNNLWFVKILQQYLFEHSYYCNTSANKASTIWIIFFFLPFSGVTTADPVVLCILIWHRFLHLNTFPNAILPICPGFGLWELCLVKPW